MDVISQLFSTFRIEANIFHNGQYCGDWAVDTSGTRSISFHLITSGSCFLRTDEEELADIEVKSGDLMIFPHDQAHCLSNDASFLLPVNQSASEDFSKGELEQGTGLVCGYLEYQHPLMTQLIEQLPETILVRGAGQETKAIHELIGLMSKLSKQDSSGIVLNKLAESLWYMVLSTEVEIASGVLAGAADPKLAKVLGAIHKEMARKWTVESMAEEAGMSRAAFADLFKKKMAMTPVDYLAQWRISSAYTWLAEEKISTLEAALKCGYDNEASFAKAFKRIIGVGPGKIRAS